MKKNYFHIYVIFLICQCATHSLWANPKSDSLLQVLSITKDTRQQYELNVQVALAVKYESVKTAVKHLQIAQGINQFAAQRPKRRQPGKNQSRSQNGCQS